MSDVEKSDIEKPADVGTETEAATATGAGAGTAAAATGGKPPTFLDKLSRFTVGNNRGELPAENGMTDRPSTK